MPPIAPFSSHLLSSALLSGPQLVQEIYHWEGTCLAMYTCDPGSRLSATWEGCGNRGGSHAVVSLTVCLPLWVEGGP